MNVKLKLGAYVVLIVLAAWFGHLFYASYQSGSGEPQQVAAPKKKKPTNSAPAVAAVTNTSSPDTNSVAVTDTNALVATTNATDQATNAASNMVAAATTPTPDTNQPASASNSNAADQDPTTLKQTISGSHEGKTIMNLALFVASAAGLGLLIALDVTRMLGEKAGDYLFDDVGEASRDPEYEKAEQIWANGKHLEAIQMLRDYYKGNPRQVHAALRIAEIYEKDLKNYLAAALEYEELLKKRLPSDRWGWAAIHLCNLYSRLGQQDKTLGLLRRIAEEHPKSGAAKKARQKLGMPEPEVLEQAEAEPTGQSVLEEEQKFEVTAEGEWPTEEEAAPPPPAAEGPKPNLPPGFRKK